MLLDFLSGEVFLSAARLKFEVNLYAHFVTGSVYSTLKVKEEDFLLYLPVECLV